MKAALIVSGGEGPPAEVLREIAAFCDLIVAADGGFNRLDAAGIKTDVIIGDMDSITVNPEGSSAAESAEIIRFDSDKDFTDSELALLESRRRDCDVLILAGGGGGRSDHFMANISLFYAVFRPDIWITADSEMILLSRQLMELPVSVERELSVFPVGSGPWKLDGKGLKWKVDDLNWEKGQYSLSNRTTSSTMELKPIEGSFLLISSIRGGNIEFSRNILQNWSRTE